LLVGILCAVGLIQHSNRPVFIYLLDAYGYFTPGIAAMFLLGIFWKRTTHAGALTAGIMTIPLSAALQYAFPRLPPMNRSGIVFWSCILTCIAVSLVTKPKPEAELAGMIWNKESLKMPPDLRRTMRGWRRPVLWWAIVTAMVLYFYLRYP
jgi:SSS family solute:Na+ symporter